ncbi:hypothetical protein ROZALSC1DRAFT_25765 [Rozella allomycis CSF55]|uniref:Uncharacterized protein n=1 Tax=Rozella allomycis (strain CSF55) TaxID=988480 RepID=A0A4P9YAQ1_ROZAC|nr:hypothetical protein ROZALSC1DRAFT_25765 [Rozella allomycis CSF55]
MSRTTRWMHSDCLHSILHLDYDKLSGRLLSVDVCSDFICHEENFARATAFLDYVTKRTNLRQNVNYALQFACNHGFTEHVLLMTQGMNVGRNRRVRPNLSAGSNYAIRMAASNGHIRLVRHLIRKSRVVPSDRKKCAIQRAASNGHAKIVKLLLDDVRVDPSDCNNYAIRWAASKGRAEVVKLLLGDVKVDPSCCSVHEYALKMCH